MDLKILGCATPYPRLGNPCSGYLLSQGESKVLLDCGSGVFAALLENMSPNMLSAIWISHLHPDHFSDVATLANWALNTPEAKRIPVFGPVSWDTRLDFFLTGDPNSGQSRKIFDVKYIADGATVELGDVSLTSIAVRHSVPAYGARIWNGRASFAYSGDTGPCDALSSLASDVDLFLCEAGTQHPAEYHLTAEQAYEVAHTARVGELVLTHIPDGAQGIDVDGSGEFPVEVAKPGDQWLIGPE